MESNNFVKKEDVIRILEATLEKISSSPRLCGSKSHEYILDALNEINQLPLEINFKYGEHLLDTTDFS